MPAIVVIFGRDRARYFNIEKGKKLIIGRSNKLPRRLNDPSISREHLEFIQQEHDGRCFVVDLESRNGARINDKRLFHMQELKDGDVIQLGYTMLVFVDKELNVNSPINKFLDKCETLYGEYLRKMRDHAARHMDKDEGSDSSSDSVGGMSGTLQIGKIWGKKDKR